MRFADLQYQAGTVPLWRDHLPELSIEVMDKGVRRELPAGVAEASAFRWTRVGECARGSPSTHNSTSRPASASTASRWSRAARAGSSSTTRCCARRSSRVARRRTCELELTYEYGADDPYVLRFTPVDGSFAPVRAAWRPVSERPPVDVTTLPVPPFPAPGPWAELTRWPRDKPGRDGQLTTDLLGWAVRAFASLGDPRTLFPDRVTGEFVEGRADHDGQFLLQRPGRR